MKNTINHIVKTVLSALIRAVGVGLFLLPNGILYGGILGIAETLQMATTLPLFKASYWLVILNIPLLVVSYFRIGKKWTIKTAVNLLLTAVFMWILDFFNVASRLGIGMENRVLFAIVGGALSGLALPLMMSIGGSTGGSDVLGMLFKKRSSTSVMRKILYFGFGTIVLGALVLKDFDVFIFSLVTLFFSEVVEEMVYRGYSAAIALEIVTDMPDKVCEALMQDTHHGVTAIKVKGMFTGVERTMVVCVLGKRQLPMARKIVRLTDPKAFAYIVNVREVVGLGFENKEEFLEDIQ